MTRRWLLALLLAPLLCASLVGTVAHAAPDTLTEFGIELIPWSKKVGPQRYESPRDWDGTLKFFKDKFKGWKTIKWTREVSLPSVKYVHIENLATGAKWQGINIYALPDGRIRYYLLAPVSAASTDAAKSAG